MPTPFSNAPPLLTPNGPSKDKILTPFSTKGNPKPASAPLKELIGPMSRIKLENDNAAFGPAASSPTDFRFTPNLARGSPTPTQPPTYGRTKSSPAHRTSHVGATSSLTRHATPRLVVSLPINSPFPCLTPADFPFSTTSSPSTPFIAQSRAVSLNLQADIPVNIPPCSFQAHPSPRPPAMNTHGVRHQSIWNASPPPPYSPLGPSRPSLPTSSPGSGFGATSSPLTLHKPNRSLPAGYRGSAGPGVSLPNPCQGATHPLSSDSLPTQEISVTGYRLYPLPPGKIFRADLAPYSELTLISTSHSASPQPLLRPLIPPPQRSGTATGTRGTGGEREEDGREPVQGADGDGGGDGDGDSDGDSDGDDEDEDQDNTDGVSNPERPRLSQEAINDHLDGIEMVTPDVTNALLETLSGEGCIICSAEKMAVVRDHITSACPMLQYPAIATIWTAADSYRRAFSWKESFVSCWSCYLPSSHCGTSCRHPVDKQRRRGIVVPLVYVLLQTRADVLKDVFPDIPSSVVYSPALNRWFFSGANGMRFVEWAMDCPISLANIHKIFFFWVQCATRDDR
ncbi:hypothetical protein FRB90_002099 [Tulasnella sp. 427]|nr:hypothetical protein FRB90_002099 [Tulasnella sp. 427]